MKKFPDWRFDFSDEWKYTELRNYIKSSSLKNSGSIYDAYSVNNKLGLVRQDEQFEDMWYEKLDKSSCKVVRPNEFAYNPARINVGSIAYNHFDYPVALSPMYIVFSTEENIHDGFLWQYFKTEQFAYELSFRLEGSVRFCLPYKNLCDVQFPNIELEEQKKISDYLEELDKAVAAQNKKILNWRELKRGLLQKIFSQEFRFIDDDGNFYPDWQEISFDEVITPKARIGWQNLRTDEYLKDGYAYLIGGTDFKNGTVSLENIWQVSKERYEMDSNIQVSAGDVLVTKDGTIGKIASVPKLDKPATLNTGVSVFRTEDRLLPKFLHYVLSSEIFEKFIRVTSAGTAVKHLNQKELKNFIFKLPCLEEQKKIADYFSELDKIISAEKEILENMRLMKKGLLQKLFA